MRFFLRKSPALFLLVIFLAAALLGCGQETRTEVTVGGHVLTVDTQAQTVTCGSDVYSYTVQRSAGSTVYHITYPNGASYYWEQGDLFGSGGWSDDYRDDIYISGDVLVDAIASYKTPRTFGSNFFIGLLVMAMGVFPAIWPQAAWYLDFGWRFKGVEPSETALVLHRVGGVILILVGIVLFFV